MGIGLTAHIVLALGRRGLGAIRMLQCNHLISEQISYQHGKSSIQIFSHLKSGFIPFTECIFYTYTNNYNSTIFELIRYHWITHVTIHIVHPESTKT